MSTAFLSRIGLRNSEEYLDFVSLNEKIDAKQNYVHPEQHPASIIEQDETNRFVTDEEKNTWNNKATTESVTQAQLKAEEAYAKAEEAFQSASNGKSLVASAITGMGVEANSNESFQQLSNKIKQIKTKAIFS